MNVDTKEREPVTERRVLGVTARELTVLIARHLEAREGFCEPYGIQCTYQDWNDVERGVVIVTICPHEAPPA